MGFTKLDERILQSSIMAEDSDTFKIWITLLAACKEDGVAEVSAKFLEGVCRIPIEKVNASLIKLSSKDENSRSLNEDGIRIKRIDGGYLIINYKKYRDQSLKSAEAERKRLYRSNNNCPDNSEKCPDTSGQCPDSSASASYSSSESKSKKKEVQEKTSDVTLQGVTPALPSLSASEEGMQGETKKSAETMDAVQVFELFRRAYPGSKRGFETEFDNFRRRHKDWKLKIFDLLSALNNQILWRKEMLDAGMFIPSWKHLQVWINQRCWEEEKPSIEKKQPVVKKFGRQEITMEELREQAEGIDLSCSTGFFADK